MNQFFIEYTDGTHFEGNALDSDWLKIDNTKEIRSVTYICGESCVIMEGYAEYNHTLECEGFGKTGVIGILLMGRKENTTEIISYDLKKNEIKKLIKPKYQEYGNQILNGWQKGYLDNPTAKFKRIKK